MTEERNYVNAYNERKYSHVDPSTTMYLYISLDLFGQILKNAYSAMPIQAYNPNVKESKYIQSENHHNLQYAHTQYAISIGEYTHM